mmetsp:Transcript_7452/g.18671  ORF Transcript_7452/g.18671 Transcript_7452/m.18671 type:complete len:154 (-) Transcript_7452:67-528(-)
MTGSLNDEHFETRDSRCVLNSFRLLKDGEDANEDDDCKDDVVERKTTCLKLFFFEDATGIISKLLDLVAENDIGATKASVLTVSALLYTRKIRRPSMPWRFRRTHTRRCLLTSSIIHFEFVLWLPGSVRKMNYLSVRRKCKRRQSLWCDGLQY